MGRSAREGAGMDGERNEVGGRDWGEGEDEGEGEGWR
jgi:hypothetical protein